MTRLRLPVSLLASLLLAPVLVACGSPPPEAKFSALQAIFTRSCNFNACHATSNPAYGNLKLAGARTDAYCALVGQAGGATHRAEAVSAGFSRRVVKGDPAKSYLHKKLVLTDAESGAGKPLGERMPRGFTLDPSEVELFARWISDGAQDDSPTAGPCP
jgi:hypothetical protein